MNGKTASLEQFRTLRKDAWWLEPLTVVIVLGAFVIYGTWAVFQNANYYAAPYLSPFYSPCIAVTCEHVTLPLVGAWWTFSPGILILWIPGGFRLTCYYYRKAYYRSFFGLPPACAVRDVKKSYVGESRFPYILQNFHRYFFWGSLVILFFLWWDAVIAFRFADGFGVGVGTLVLITNAALLSLYSFSCHSCRHICGGYLDSFRGSPSRFKIWRVITRMNEKHMLIAWVSLVWVALTDVYVRLLAVGAITDLRIL